MKELSPTVKAINDIRLARNLNYEDLSRLSGVPPHTIRRNLVGDREPLITTLEAICTGLGVSLKIVANLPRKKLGKSLPNSAQLG